MGGGTPRPPTEGPVCGPLSCISPLPTPAVKQVPTQLCVIRAFPSSDLALSSTEYPQVGRGRPTGALTSTQALDDIIELVVPAPWRTPWELGECSGEGGPRKVTCGGS